VLSGLGQRGKWTAWPGTEGCCLTVKRVAGPARGRQQASKTTPVGRSTRQGVEEVQVEALAPSTGSGHRLAGGGLESQGGGFLD